MPSEFDFNPQPFEELPEDTQHEAADVFVRRATGELTAHAGMIAHAYDGTLALHKYLPTPGHPEPIIFELHQPLEISQLEPESETPPEMDLRVFLPDTPTTETTSRTYDYDPDARVVRREDVTGKFAVPHYYPTDFKTDGPLDDSFPTLADFVQEVESRAQDDEPVERLQDEDALRDELREAMDKRLRDLADESTRHLYALELEEMTGLNRRPVGPEEVAKAFDQFGRAIPFLPPY